MLALLKKGITAIREKMSWRCLETFRVGRNG